MKIFSMTFLALAFVCLNAHLIAQEAMQPAASSVPKGINDNFKNPDLDVDEWIERFEVESREVYALEMKF